MNSGSNKIFDLFLQIIPVMIGVFLGFLVNDWREDNQRKEQADIFLENVLLEINTNQKKLDRVFDYHVMLRDSSRVFSDLSMEEVTNYSRPNFFKGTRLFPLVNAAYETGKQTGALNELPIKTIQHLNLLYNLQDDYNEYGKLITMGFINIDFNNQPEVLLKVGRFMAISMTDIVIKEDELIKGYKVVSELLEKEI